MTIASTEAEVLRLRKAWYATRAPLSTYHPDSEAATAEKDAYDAFSHAFDAWAAACDTDPESESDTPRRQAKTPTACAAEVWRCEKCGWTYSSTIGAGRGPVLHDATQLKETP
jgi:hypothetical protein